MSVPVAEMEFERMMNLLRPFAWDLVSKKSEADRLELTIRKQFTVNEMLVRETTLNRAKNPLKAFGWEVVSEQVADTVFTLTARKTLSPELSRAVMV